MERAIDVASRLLPIWCEGMLKYQIRGTGDGRLDGAFLCPACHRIHGRSADAIYPFISMYSATKDEKWLDAAQALFEWSLKTVSCRDGSYVNDVDSSWRGITVFALLSLLNTLTIHKTVLPKQFADRLEKRAFRAAEYLARHDEYKNSNTNYPISIALALYKAGIYFNNGFFAEKAGEYKALIDTLITENGLIYGESTPRDRLSPKGCHSVDIAYNVEETIPAIVELALLDGDIVLKEKAISLLRSHLYFFMPDGSWDESFSTRLFKWTWWGSRTSDGAAAALLMLSDADEVFPLAAVSNLKLMESCTREGLLYGGPDCHDAAEPVCIHHTFTHAKVLATIVDMKLDVAAMDVDLSRYSFEGIRYFKEVDTYIATYGPFSATVTGYDWPYMKGGHASGGTLSMLYEKSTGPVAVSGMCDYSIREKNNQQFPQGRLIHECLSPRIDSIVDGKPYSSIYSSTAVLSASGENSITASGLLQDADGNSSEIGYRLEYSFSADSLSIKAEMKDARIIFPIISRQGECVRVEGKSLFFDRGLVFEVVRGVLSLPYGFVRIFNLVPGLEALKTEIEPDSDGFVELRIRRNDE